MLLQVAQVLSDAATERQANEAKLEALRAHIKQQDVQISNLRHTHHIQRGEWEVQPHILSSLSVSLRPNPMQQQQQQQWPLKQWLYRVLQHWWCV